MRTAALVGAERLDALIGGVEVAAASGTDPMRIAQAVAALHPRLGVCVVDATISTCAGGELPSHELVEADVEARRQGVETAHSEVTSYDTLVIIDVVGPDATVIAQVPAAVLGDGDDLSVWVATTDLPSGLSDGEFAVDRGVRQTATSARTVAGVHVVAVGKDAVELPDGEMHFYVVILVLSVVLLALAGITLFGEQRNLLERASIDPLTRLPNRGEFERRAMEAIAEAARTETGICLLLFDLDGFKLVNDTYGHTTGDEMLKVVGSRLRKAVRDDDVVARWGGDEFVVLMPGVTGDAMCARRAEQLAEQIAGRTRLDGVSEVMRVKVSVGVATWPDHASELSDLVEAADRAMYQAKRDGVVFRVAGDAPAPV
jgi:diguanylate cyclase (GGDEF)-like protein